jgi:MFS family permease
MMTPVTDVRAEAAPARLTAVQWVICAVACLGFAFDTYEITVLALIVRPAITELGGLQTGAPEFNLWVGLLFFVPLAVGGAFGLLGGYLTDRFGRRRVLTYSILLYGFSALATGYTTSLPMLLFFRCATLVGVCVEFVAAVAWLAELFPNPKRRESVLGYTQVSSALGGFMVAGVYYLAVTYGDHLPAVRGGHEAWRYSLMFGAIPAFPLMVIRPFLPESPVWREKKAAGALKRPSLAGLFSPALRKTTLITTLLVACSFGASFGAQQHVPRIVPGLPQVRHLARQQQEQTVSVVKVFMVAGDLAGRLALALLVIRVVSRRRLLHIFQLAGLIVVPLVFLFPARYDLELLKYGVFLATALMVAQFSFWGNYLPRVFPTHLRGTGESFATNIGGRVLGTSAALLTTQLANVMPGGGASAQLAYAAACVAFLVFLIALIASFWLPEPKQEQLPE